MQSQSETVWRQADRYGVPRVAYINKMDRTGADFMRVVHMINDQLGSNAVPIQLPIGVEDDFTGIIDLIELKAYEYEDLTGGASFTERELHAHEKEEAALYREHLLEKLAEHDDKILEKYLEGHVIRS